MSTTAEYHLHVTLVLLFAWAGTATAEPRKFTLNQPETRNLGVWRLTHDPVIRDEGNYHNIQCWSPNGRYTCYTHWGVDNSPGGKGSAEVHVVDLKTGEERLVDKGINPRWANQHNWLFYCHYTGDGRPPYETGTQVIRYDADTGEKVAIAHGIECPGGTDSTDTWLYGTQRFRGRKPEFVTVRVRNQPGSSLDAIPGVPNRHSYVHVNPRHPVVMMRAKHPEDGPLGTNRVLFDLDGGNVRQGAVMLEEGHVCWRGDGEYLLIGNRHLCGRRWDRPFPSDLETMACGGGGDVCPADRAGRYVVMGNLGIADTRSGDTWHVLTPHSSIIYPLQGDNSTLMDIDPKGSPDGTKIHFHSTRDLENVTVARITAYEGRNEPDVIHVDSTDGFPDSGDLGSRWEVIGYRRKTATTFEGLTRRKYETKPEPFAEALVQKVRWLFPLSEFVLTGPDKTRAQPDAVMLRAGIAKDNPLLYQRQTNCYIVVVRLPFPPHLRKKGNRVELIPGEHHWETRGFRILRDGGPIREELFALGDSFRLAQPGTHTAVAVEQSGLESPPSLPLGIVIPVEGEVLRDKPDDFSWTNELWQVAGKSVSRQEAMGGVRATMELAHLHDGIIAREQWGNGQRAARVDLNEDGKPIRRLEFEDGRLRKRTYQTAEGYLASEEFYGPDGYKTAHVAYYTREDRRGQESYRWQYNRGRPVKKTYRGKVVYED